jgi:hypothetical protein
MHHQQTPPRGVAAILRRPQGTALAAVLIATLIYLLVGHAAHILIGLPYVFVLLCPLMHLLMMRGMHCNNLGTPPTIRFRAAPALESACRSSSQRGAQRTLTGRSEREVLGRGIAPV